jgi:MoaA/NifB/PqqE/SkfB family radical SAM enzyme
MPSLPAHLQDGIRINWHISSWCNYSCEYCPVLVFHQRSKSGQKQDHAFDVHSVREWLDIFRELPYREIHLSISGGEPFLDRKNFHSLLAGLLAMPGVQVRVATNAFWDPAEYRDLDTSRVTLGTAYHPQQVAFEEFRRNLHRIRDCGFKIGMVNYVLAPENLKGFESVFETLEGDGFFVNVSAMMSAGIYHARTERTDYELDLIERYNTPSDNYFKLVKPRTKGRLCFYPAMTYYILYDGSIQAACLDGTIRNLFTDGIPPVPRQAVPCEYERCVGCADMYRGLIDEPMVNTPLGFFPPDEYVREVRTSRERYRVEGAIRRLSSSPARMMPSVREMLQEAAALEPETLISISSAPAPLPDRPIFGGNDQSRIVARSRDRISVSGWAASRDHGAPVREIRMTIGGRQVGVFRDFFERADIVTTYGRSDLLKCGWRGMIYLPALPHGDHELVPEAYDGSGNFAPLAPCAVTIVD